MAEFDVVAYGRTVELFNEARKARKSLPSLAAQAEDSLNTLKAASFEPRESKLADDGAVPAAAARHSALVDQLNARKAAYERAVADCERVIACMEDSDDGGGTDSAVLRYYYLQGMTESQVFHRLRKDGTPHAESYIHEKKEIALVRASASVRRLGLV